MLLLLLRLLQNENSSLFLSSSLLPNQLTLNLSEISIWRPFLRKDMLDDDRLYPEICFHWGVLLRLSITRKDQPEIFKQWPSRLYLEYSQFPVRECEGANEFEGLAVHQGLISTINLGPHFEKKDCPGTFRVHPPQRPIGWLVDRYHIIDGDCSIASIDLRDDSIPSSWVETRTCEQRLIVFAREETHFCEERWISTLFEKSLIEVAMHWRTEQTSERFIEKVR